MSCEFTEKVSALLDEELDEQEAGGLREHLAACDICRQAEHDFLLLRREIKSYAGAELHLARRQQRALLQILGSENIPLWKRRIALPAPALALLLLAVIFLGIWMASARWQKGRAPLIETAGEEKRVVPRPAPQPAGTESEIDLARFDRGGRAVIYKVRRENSEDARH